jgi:hypothetical protein
MDIEDQVRGQLRTVSLVGVSIIVSLLLYLGMAEFIRARFRPFRGFTSVTNLQLIRYIFFALAIVTVILIRILRQVLLKKSPLDDRKGALQRLQRASLVAIVLAEVPGLLGLILFFLAGLNIDFYLLLFASLLLVFMYFPRRSGWEEWLKG